jgi:hypothetical protein
MTRTMMQKKQMVIHEFGIHVVTMQDAAVGFTFYRWLVLGTGVRVPGSQIPSRHTYAL